MFPALGATVVIGQVQAQKLTITGDVRKISSFESKFLGNRRDIWVYLPRAYITEPARKFKVVYLMDGQNVFDESTSFLGQEWRADESAYALEEAGLIEPVVIVAVSNGGLARADEYLPTRAVFQGNEGGGKANEFAKFITRELMPAIQTEFRILTGPENTAVGGSSFGGIVAYHLAFSHPDRFGMAAIMSPSVWWDDRYVLRQVQSETGKPKLKLWLDMGTGEGRDMVVDCQQFAQGFVSRGWTKGKDFVYYEDPRAEHNERAWASRLPLVLRFFFGQVAR